MSQPAGVFDSTINSAPTRSMGLDWYVPSVMLVEIAHAVSPLTVTSALLRRAGTACANLMSA